MATLFVTATGTGVGKTYTSVRLMEILADMNIRTGVYKAIETGVSSIPQDAATLLDVCKKYNPEFSDLTPADITSYTFTLPAAPFCADIDKEISIDKIIEKASKLKERCELLIVEGAGGLMVPIKDDFFMIDLAAKLNASVLLVSPSRLGCINETLLGIEALERRNIPYEWCVNLYEEAESFSTITQPYYDAVFENWWSLQHGLENFAEKLPEK